MNQSSSSTVFIVAGLLYGDEGKGTTVEFLAHKHKAKLVVRYGGGPQAAHHVVLKNGTWHCFSQCGSASFLSDVNTLLSKYMVVNPLNLVREVKVLQSKGVDIVNRMFIDKECFIVTPFHRLVNQVRETLRNKSRHGSTGIGVGLTIDEAFFSNPSFFPKGEICYDMDRIAGCEKKECLQIKDLLLPPDELKKKLEQLFKEKLNETMRLIKAYKERKLERLVDSISGETEQMVDEEILSQANGLMTECLKEFRIAKLMELYQNFVKDYSHGFCDGSFILSLYVSRNDNIIFEGAQGALLDRIHGFYPHLTKSLCTDDNAFALLSAIKTKPKIVKVGVLRSYSSRHGAGPFVSYDESYSKVISEDHNQTSQWQGEFKLGPFDLVAASYGVKIFKPDVLSITCIDKLYKASILSDNIKMYPLCSHYIFEGEDNDNTSPNSEKNKSEATTKIQSLELRPDIKAYKSLEYSLLMRKCKPEIIYLSQRERMQSSDKFLSVLKNTRQLKGNDLNDLSNFLAFIEENLGTKIQILSFGPTKEDKYYYTHDL